MMGKGELRLLTAQMKRCLIGFDKAARNVWNIKTVLH
jgi:hypothetical protein